MRRIDRRTEATVPEVRLGHTEHAHGLPVESIYRRSRSTVNEAAGPMGPQLRSSDGPGPTSSGNESAVSTDSRWPSAFSPPTAQHIRTANRQDLGPPTGLLGCSVPSAG